MFSFHFQIKANTFESYVLTNEKTINSIDLIDSMDLDNEIQ